MSLAIRQIIVNIYKSETDFTCKFHYGIRSIFSELSPWILVGVTVERCIAVWFPHKAKVWLSKKKAYVYLSILVFVSLVLRGHFLFTIEETKRYCLPVYAKFPWFISDLLPWVSAIVYLAIPFLILLISNIFIITRLLFYFYKFSRNVTSHEQGVGDIIGITSVVLLLSSVFLILNGPYYYVTILVEPITSVYMKIEKSDYTDAIDDYASTSILYSIIKLMFHSSYAINLWLHLLSGNKFRKQFVKIFCKVCIRQESPEETVETT